MKRYRTRRLRGDDDDLGTLPLYLGPYEFWNFGKGLGYTLPGMRKGAFRFITALAEFKRPRTKRRRAKTRVLPRTTWVPTLWKVPEVTFTFTPFVVENPSPDTITLDALRELLGSAFHGELQIALRVKEPRFRVAFPIASAAMNSHLPSKPYPPNWQPDPGLPGRIGTGKRITVAAIIDDGLPFAHRRFRDRTGRRTRVEFCWLQSVEHERRRRPSVLFGREYTREQIEDYIQRYGDDEDTLYREAGATADTEGLGPSINRHASHGGHVMDLFTGYAPERGEDPAEEIRIIAVQLPNTIAWDTSGFGKDMYMLSAFHYIFDRADRIARGYCVDNLRLVINFSYGFSGGRHDAKTELEAAIDELVQARRQCVGPTALVLPAGNTFLDRLHGTIREENFVKNETEFQWRLQPNDRTPSYLELWFGQSFDPTGYWIALQSPSGRTVARLRIAAASRGRAGDPLKVSDVGKSAKPIGQLSADKHRDDDRPGHEDGRWRVLVVMAPSESEDSSLPSSEAGSWRVIIKRTRRAKPLKEPVHCWIQRDTDPATLRSGSRQSYFDDLDDARYGNEGALHELDTDAAFIRRFGSLNGLATGYRSLIVAGFRLGAGLGSTLAQARPARYSSAGTLEEGWPEAKVACSSMSDRSMVVAGTVAAGARSGARSFVQGTSAAAPFVARRLVTAFVIADEADVARAEPENYRPLLLPGSWVAPKKDPTKARLGAVRVRPHRQPGLEP